MHTCIMTLQQLEYIVAVDIHRHFGKAAASCFITQPSLSMQVQKLEEELKVKIFSRTSFPVTPTETGILLIEHAKKILSEAKGMHEIIQAQQASVAGHLRLGIIPTLAPYLLPLFLYSFIKKYPYVRISITELTTQNMVRHLKNGSIDAGILATPLQEPQLRENVLFYEEFVAYVSRKDVLLNKKYLLPGDIDVSKLWLLEEGHCLRNQVMNFCELQKHSALEKHFDYETGSIETLKRFVEKNQGITLLPELATLDMAATKKQMLRYFKAPAPAREISIVTLKTTLRRRLVELLEAEIINSLPPEIKRRKNLQRLGIE